MPKSNTSSSSTKRTSHVKFPVKSDGSTDKRYKVPQFTTNNGKRDMRTNLTGNRK